MQLGQGQQRVERTGTWLVDRLEEAASPDPVVDQAASPEQLHHGRIVYTPRPADVTKRVVLLRPLTFEKGLRAAVPPLLVPVGAHGAAAMMPDHRRRTEADAQAALGHPPTHVDIVA